MRRSPGPYSAEVIVAPHGLSADRVGSAVRADWGVDVTFVEHLEIGDGGWHWRLGDEFGPQWFASAHPVRSADERQRRLAAYDAATRLAAVLPFVVAPVRTRDARLAVDVASGLVLTLVPLLEVFAPGPRRQPRAGRPPARRAAPVTPSPGAPAVATADRAWPPRRA